MADKKALEERLQELENLLRAKDGEIKSYRDQLYHLNTRLERLVTELSQELRFASLIQKKLSPTEIPNLSGVEFSTKFVPGVRYGGDYFDVFELEDKMKFGILLASSSGYSMSALFLSVLIKLSGQIEARRGMEPHKVIEMIAGELCDQLQEKDQASLFYALVDRRNFEMKYSCAGRMSCLWFAQGSEKPSLLESSAGPLVKDFKDTPLTDVIAMGPRDRLILISEGALLAQDASGQSFGKERLLQSVLRAPRLGVHEVRNEILFQLESFVGKPEFQKDVTVIVTEVKDRVIKLAKKSSS
jgi:sigma-B regulation protein RsbU (phosphoserine phosphatase)